MGNSRRPGPLGIGYLGPVDDGTLPRFPSPIPGPTGLYAAVGNAVRRPNSAALSNSGVDPIIKELGGSNRNFQFGGESYRFINALNWGYASSADSYQVVPPAQAKTIVEGLASASGTSAKDRVALKDALAVLEAARAAVQPGHILMLRHVVMAPHAVSAPAPANPAQPGPMHRPQHHDRPKAIVLESIKVHLAPMPFLKSLPKWWPQNAIHDLRVRAFRRRTHQPFATGRSGRRGPGKLRGHSRRRLRIHFRGVF